MIALSTLPRLAAKNLARTASAAAIKAAGTDMTDEITGRPSLVIAPHPDDETLGCGATIARMRARGTPVIVVLLTGGGQSPRPIGMSTGELVALRRAEATRAVGLLGVDDASIVMLDLQDGALPAGQEAASKAIASVIAATGVEQVMVTSIRDRHPDHASAARATLAAVAGSHPRIKVYEYAIWQRVPAVGMGRNLIESKMSARSRAGQATRSRPHLVSTAGFLPHKQDAIAVYESQLPHFPALFLRDFLLPFETFYDVRLKPPS